VGKVLVGISDNLITKMIIKLNLFYGNFFTLFGSVGSGSLDISRGNHKLRSSRYHGLSK
jgi:hypothetical protein